MAVEIVVLNSNIEQIKNAGPSTLTFQINIGSNCNILENIRSESIQTEIISSLIDYQSN